MEQLRDRKHGTYRNYRSHISYKSYFSYFSPVRFLLALLFTAAAALATPPDLWPLAVKALPLPALPGQCAQIDAATGALAPELKPAARFQKVFLQAVSGAPESAWLPGFERFVSSGSATPAVTPLAAEAVVTSALAEVSRTWIARYEMRLIDGSLRKFYKKHVAFPAQFSEIAADLPEALRRDPWGQPWFYTPHAPAMGERFAKFTTQRYKLAPTRFPELGTLATATGDRNASIPAWKITAHDLGGKKALEFRTDGKVATLEPGGKVNAFTLLYIGDRWALMAGVDQLFTLTY